MADVLKYILQTVFETFDKKDNPIGTICVPLTRGMALLHR